MPFKPFKHELCIPDSWSVLNTLKSPSMAKDHFENMFKGDAQLNLMNLFREVCDAISEEMGYEFGNLENEIPEGKIDDLFIKLIKLTTFSFCFFVVTSLFLTDFF